MIVNKGFFFSFSPGPLGVRQNNLQPSKRVIIEQWYTQMWLVRFQGYFLSGTYTIPEVWICHLLLISGVALLSLTICNFYKQNVIEITYFYFYIYVKKKKNLQGFVITPDLQYLKMNVKLWCQLLKNHLETRNRGSDSAAVPQHEWFFCFSSGLWRPIFNQIKLCEKEQQGWALSHLALSKNWKIPEAPEVFTEDWWSPAK